MTTGGTIHSGTDSPPQAYVKQHVAILHTVCNNLLFIYLVVYKLSIFYRGRRGHHRMVVGYTTTCAISTYHH